MTIEMRLHSAGQVTPRSPARGRFGDGTQDPDEVVGGLLGEGPQAIRSGRLVDARYYRSLNRADRPGKTAGRARRHASTRSRDLEPALQPTS